MKVDQRDAEGRWGGKQVLELKNVMAAIAYQLFPKMKVYISFNLTLEAVIVNEMILNNFWNIYVSTMWILHRQWVPLASAAL